MQKRRFRFYKSSWNISNCEILIGNTKKLKALLGCTGILIGRVT